MRASKEALRRLTAAGLPDDDDLVAAAYGSADFREGVAAYGSADFREGVAAFLAKRRPRWTGL